MGFSTIFYFLLNNPALHLIAYNGLQSYNIEQ